MIPRIVLLALVAVAVTSQAAITEVVKLIPQKVAAAEVVALSAEPARVKLQLGEVAQILITAKMKDGFDADATDSVTFAPGAGDALKMEGGGRLRALKTGTTSLVGTLGNQRVEVSVEITPPPADAKPTFIHDVLPVLSKAGCNAGSCHAKPDGQNGFKLSVFSYDPKGDFNQIVKDDRGRRIFPAAPAESLLLLKATQTIPHEGGERFDSKSDAYRILTAWIKSGTAYEAAGEPRLKRISVMPAERRYRKGATQRLQVFAHYSDGSARDVTGLAGFAANDKEIARVTEDGLAGVGKVNGQAVIVARFMGLVAASQFTVPADKLLPASQYAGLPVRNFIDGHAYTHFKELGLFPSDTCTDAEFIRRATFDTIGALPTAEEAAAFLEDQSPDKRDQLIERLLASGLYADFWANKFADLLRPNPDRVGVKSVYTLDQWLRAAFRENRPYDQLVREIVLGEGSNHRDGPAVIYRDRREPEDLTTMFSQLFLGVRLDCAKCHHHPNEKWSQDDFYKMAAFFGTVKRKGAALSPPISAGQEVFFFGPGATVKHPVTGQLMPPQPPDGPLAKADDKTDPRRSLADWLGDPKNPFFAKAIANRVWAAYFGRGIVDPVDDFRISNPASNPALLDALAKDLVAQKYDLKALMRTILRSHLYQLSSTPNDTNRADTKNFSRAYRRRLPAEVIADALSDVTGVPTKYPGLPEGSRAMQTWTYKIDSQTMDAFGRPNSSSDCPCERDTRPSMVQSLHLMNSRQLQSKMSSDDGRLKRLVTTAKSPDEIVKQLYLTCYSRQPVGEELQVATAAFGEDKAKWRATSEDLLWALLNSAEFVFNH
jgi:hypothetical protein